MTITIKSNTIIRPNVTVKGFAAPILKFDATSYTSGTTWFSTGSNKITGAYSFGSDFGFGGIKLVGSGSNGIVWLMMGGADPLIAYLLEHLHIGDTVSIDIGGGFHSASITSNSFAYSGPNGNVTGMTGFALSDNQWVVTGTADVNVGSITTTTSSYATLHGDINIFDGATARFFTLTGTGGAEEGYAQVTPGVYFNHSFTAEGWVYVNSVTTWARFFDFGNAGSDEVLIAVSEANTGYPVFSVSGENIVSPYALPVGEWVHLSGTYNYATKTGTLYMNGTQVVTQVNMAQATQNTYRNQCYIGKSNWGADSNLEGAVGELAIYPFAMSGTEVLAQYNNRKTHYGL